MNKNFDQWNVRKKQLEVRRDKFLYKEGEVWWCSLGLNIGTESCGKGKDFRRPVLVLKKLSQNHFIGIPISTQRKTKNWFCQIEMFSDKSYLLLYQIRMFNTQRFQRRLAAVGDKYFLQIKQKLGILLEL